jgi:hypothetical protein
MDFSTKSHDLAHRWVYYNKYRVLEFVADKRNFDLDKDTCYCSIKLEEPIFHPKTEVKRYIIDGILDLVSSIHCSPSTKTMIGVNGKTVAAVNGRIVKSFSGRELHLLRDSIYRRIVFDIKVKLDTVSQLMSQLKSYQHFTRYFRTENSVKSQTQYNSELLVITPDTTKIYDDMLFSQGILVYHIPLKGLTK